MLSKKKKQTCNELLNTTVYYIHLKLTVCFVLSWLVYKKIIFDSIVRIKYIKPINYKIKIIKRTKAYIL